MSIQKAYIDNIQIFLINGLVDSCHWYYLELFGKSQIIQSISASVISGKAGYINIPKDKLPQKENKIESEFLSFWGEGKIKREITQLENGYAHCCSLLRHGMRMPDAILDRHFYWQEMIGIEQVSSALLSCGSFGTDRRNPGGRPMAEVAGDNRFGQAHRLRQ